MELELKIEEPQFCYGVRLSPGVNKITEEEWGHIKKSKWVQLLISRGEIVLSNNSFDSLSVKAQKEKINTISDTGYLHDLMESGTSSKSVKVHIAKRIRNLIEEKHGQTNN